MIQRWIRPRRRGHAWWRRPGKVRSCKARIPSDICHALPGDSRSQEGTKRQRPFGETLADESAARMDVLLVAGTASRSATLSQQRPGPAKRFGPLHVCRLSARALAMVLVGAAAGLTLGLASERFVASLLYGVIGTEMSMMTLPPAVLLLAVALAAAPAVMQAVRIDPAAMLRSEL